MKIKRLKSAFPGERFDKLVVVSAVSENEADMTTAAFYRRLRKRMTEEQAILTPKAK
jgi:hypothetical protein